MRLVILATGDLSTPLGGQLRDWTCRVRPGHVCHQALSVAGRPAQVRGFDQSGFTGRDERHVSGASSNDGRRASPPPPRIPMGDAAADLRPCAAVHEAL